MYSYIASYRNNYLNELCHQIKHTITMESIQLYAHVLLLVTVNTMYVAQSFNIRNARNLKASIYAEMGLNNLLSVASAYSHLCMSLSILDRNLV